MPLLKIRLGETSPVGVGRKAWDVEWCLLLSDKLLDVGQDFGSRRKEP